MIKQRMRNQVLPWSCHKYTALVKFADFFNVLLVLTKWDDHKFVWYDSMFNFVLGSLVTGTQYAIVGKVQGRSQTDLGSNLRSSSDDLIGGVKV